MQKKLKVLISAYACEPHKGSEPEIGWQWSLEMARHHEVTVLTRSNNRAAIEKEIAPLQGIQPLPRFVYHDEAPWLLTLKRRFKAIRIYYILWQVSATKLVRQLVREERFDLLHHVTIGGFRYRTAIWNHGVPAVWGPVGGVESIPWRLLPWRHWSSLLPEVFRAVNNFIQSAPFHALPARAQLSAATLVSTREMYDVFTRLGLEAVLMPSIGLDMAAIPVPVGRRTDGPLKLLFVGKIITLKGIDLAIEALHESGVDATFTVIGEGGFLGGARKLVKRLGLGDRVRFVGGMKRQKVLESYAGFDILFFPSLHDTGSYAVLEAMACGLAVICVDIGGPGVSVREESGIKVPVGSRHEVIQNLAGALRKYAGNRELVVEHGLNGREVVRREYAWDQKGRQLDAVYQRVAAGVESQTRPRTANGRPGVLNRIFPVRGLAFSALILFIIGIAGFFSVNNLRRNAEAIVLDTLPGLSQAGAAADNLGEAFNRILLMVMTDDPAELNRLRSEVADFHRRTSLAVTVYKESIFGAEDRANYADLLSRRRKFEETSQRVLELIDARKRADALFVTTNSLLPAYRQCKDAAEKVLAFNVREGGARGHSIMITCTTTQFLVAAAGVLLFAVGFIIGLFK